MYDYVNTTTVVGHKGLVQPKLSFQLWKRHNVVPLSLDLHRRLTLHASFSYNSRKSHLFEKLKPKAENRKIAIFAASIQKTRPVM